jgi:hypothetical protein
MVTTRKSAKCKSLHYALNHFFAFLEKAGPAFRVLDILEMSKIDKSQ